MRPWTSVCLAALLLVVGCEEKKAGTRKGGMKVRAAKMTVRSTDGTIVEDVTFTIDPTQVRARRGDRQTWTLAATNNRADDLVQVLAEVRYTADDGTTVTRGTSADLVITGDIDSIVVRLGVPTKTVYVPGSFTVDGVAQPDPPVVTGMLEYLTTLPAGATVTLTYTTELVLPPPPPPF